MRRVEWTLCSGDQVEDFVSQLILLDSPNVAGNRVRASRGDGGIDVILRHDTEVEIFQVKKFATNLTAGQKSQIKESFDRFLSEVASTQQVRAWHLVLPLDPTRENLIWFDEMVGSQPFPCDWIGLNQLDALAAGNAKLVEYHFGDPKAMQDLVTRLLGAREIPGVDLRPEDRIEAMGQNIEAMIESLEDLDPHYRYEMALFPEFDLQTFDPNDLALPKGTVFVQYQGLASGRCVAIFVIARCSASLELRPITLTTQFVVERGSVEEAALQDFADYGAPISGIAGSLVEGVGPALTTTSGSGLISFWPTSKTADTPPLELRVQRGSDVLDRVPLALKSISSGTAEEPGQYLECVSGTGLITVLARIGGAERKSRLDLKFGSLANRTPRDAIELIDLQESLLEGDHLALAIEDGNRVSPLWEISDRPDSMQVAERRRLCESLATIQRVSMERIGYPAAATEPQIAMVHVTAGLLRGEHIEVPWRPVALDPATLATLDPVDAENGFAFGYMRPLVVILGDRTIDTGKFYLTWCTSARLEDGWESTLANGQPVEILAVDGATSTLRLATPDETKQLETGDKDV